MRLLFYATNGLGLGHVTRLLCIIRALRKMDDSHEVLFLTRCEAGPYRKEDDLFTIRIPGPARARSSGLTPKSYLQMAHPLLWQTVSSFDPHLLVTDTFPEGPERELAPLMKWPIKKAFVYRDSREGAWEAQGLRKSLDFYQRILVAHAPESLALPREFAQDPRVHFTGTISERIGESGSREPLRQRLGLGADPTAVVTLGGGGDPEALGSLPEIVEGLRCRNIPFFVATGPLTREIPFPVSAREWLPLWPLAPWLPAFDMAVASGGYNTVAELRAAGLPSLLIPFRRDPDDQEKRVDQAVREGWGLSARPDDPSGIGDGLDRLAERAGTAGRVEERNSGVESGAEIAASLLLDLVCQKSVPAPPFPGPEKKEISRVPVR